MVEWGVVSFPESGIKQILAKAMRGQHLILFSTTFGDEKNVMPTGYS